MTRWHGVLALVAAMALTNAPVPSSAADEPAKIKTWFTIDHDGADTGKLFLQAKLAEGASTYSVTERDQTLRTEITLDASSQYREAGPVQPNWESLQLAETHTGTVTWFVPLRFTAGVDPAKVSINGAVVLRVYDGQKTSLVSHRFFGADYEPPAGRTKSAVPAGFGSTSLQNHMGRPVSGLLVAQSETPNDAPAAVRTGNAESPVPVRAWLTADGADSGVISVQVALAEGCHTYSVTEAVESCRTRIALVPSGQYRQTGAVRPSVDPQATYDLQLLQPVEKHAGTVTWTVPVRFAPDVDPTRMQIGGHIDLTVCDARECRRVSQAFVAGYQAAADSAASATSAVAEAPQYPISAPAEPLAALQEDKFDDPLSGLAITPRGKGGNELTVKASVEPAKGDKPAQVVIEATVAKGWHIYSITQPKGGPLPTKLDVKIVGDASLAGDFQADPPPKKVFDNEAFKMEVEKHVGTVRWTAPLTMGADAEARGLKISGTLSGQRCNDADGQCVPVNNLPFVAIDTTTKANSSVGEYRAPNSNVIIRGQVEPATVAPGGTVKLLLTAEPQGEYHVYPVKEKPKTAKPTLIVAEAPKGWTVSEPTPNSPAVVKDGDAYHTGKVTWTVEIKVPADAKPGEHKLEGGIAYMACIFDKTCEPPKGATFEASINVGSGGKSDPKPPTFFPGNYAEVEKRALGAAEVARREALRKRVTPVLNDVMHAMGVDLYSHDELSKYSGVKLDQLPESGDKSSGLSFLAVLASLGGGFLGGLILNVMPCVLPVIGLKIMSFMQQGGESRGRVFLLNVWFSLGLISVFLILAAMAAFLNLGWGGQFQQAWFTIVLACVVFAFALAMVGVWEVPIPGFIGSSGSINDLATQEGAAGAFSKGVLTTLLATPCTGPFLGPALAWALNQPLPLVFATFLSVGIGMASPYLLIGAYPQLISFLPRPGMWMETFKKVMGFILLATVVWLLSLMPPTDVLPTITVLCGLGLAFWWIGHVPLTESAGKRYFAWVQGGVVIVAAAFFSFGWLDDVMRDRASRKFKSDMVNQLVKYSAKPETLYETPARPAGRYTVMVDFTADWCLTCKTNEQFFLSSKKTKELIKQNNIVFLVADMTQDHPEAQDLLKRLGNPSSAIPYVAIFPADRPNEPIVLEGPLTQGQLNRAIEQAGPSQVKAEGEATAMRENATY